MTTVDRGGKKRAMAYVRAAVARAKAKNYETSEREAAHRFRSDMRKAMLSAKKHLRSDQHLPFLQETDRLTRIQRQRFLGQPIEFDQISLVDPGPSTSLENELSWCKSLVSVNSSAIAKFIAQRSAVSTLVMAGDLGAAIFLLDQIDNLYGVSLWSVELRIAIYQWRGTQDEQKKFTKSTKDVYKRGILPYIASFFSQRAESSVPIAWFLENANRRASRIEEYTLSVYVKYKALSDLPKGAADKAAILHLEQNHHIIDIYETLVRLVEAIIFENEQTQIFRQAVRICNELQSLGDPRFKMMLHAVETPVQPTDSREKSSILSHAFSREPARAYRTYRRILSSTPDNSMAIIGLGVSKISTRSGASRAIPRNTTLDFLIRAIEPVLSRTDQTAVQHPSGINSLEKFAHIFSPLQFGRAFQHLILAQRSTSIEAATPHLKSLALAGSDSWLLGFASDRFANLKEASDGVCRASLIACGSYNYSPNTTASSFCEAADALFSRDPETAYEVIRPYVESNNRFIANNATLLAMSALSQSESVRIAASLIATALMRDRSIVNHLPVETVFAGLEWEDMEPCAHLIDFSIALDVYARFSKDDRVHSYQCFALMMFLQSLNADRPSRLRSKLEELPKDQAAYFLGEVCSFALLDMLPSLSNTREVLEERREICALLVNLSLDPFGNYRQELLTITQQLSVQRGLRTFDGSRVHVDTHALRNAMKKDLNESFQRFLSLQETAPTTSESFDVLLRELTKKEGQVKHLLSIPDNESDELAYSMIARTRESFLFNVPHGLDSYLSKRVRHGSIVGHIRAPVEKEGLITQRAKDGTYRANERWIHSTEGRTRAELSHAFSSFARTFDQHLSRLKDVMLHVRSETHPLGVFDAPLNPPLYHLIRSVALKDKSLDTFLTTIFGSLWGLLNPSLQTAKNYILTETSRHVAASIASLRARVSQILPAGRELTELDSALGRASASTQAAVEAVAEWFEPVDIEEFTYSSTEIVEIAENSVRSIFPTYASRAEVRAWKEYTFSSAGMAVLVDILFVALGNIAEWSGLDNPQVRVLVRDSPADKVIRIRIENEVRLVTDFASVEARINEKRELLKNTNMLDMARKDRDSGFFKIASITSQSDLGRFDFGFDSSELFFVEVDLSLPEGTTGDTDENIDI